jgi:Ca2+-binding RTX toxin-like protein
VFASVSYTLGAGVQVEKLTTSSNTATTAIDLTGNELANYLAGNAGANVLDGKGGADTLLGLAGADLFAFTTALGGGNVDTIGDFSVADDTIQLENAVFTGLAAGALAAGAFNTGAARDPGRSPDHLQQRDRRAAVRRGRRGRPGSVQFATLGAGLGITASDFLVI